MAAEAIAIVDIAVSYKQKMNHDSSKLEKNQVLFLWRA
eukprot:CAMPEP_0201891478 /NCGR_PEP_ID=MMETSP0902-20130614/34530_1 /ASSEMBLY_ACC=CAM_ASM_000551 /TAXON_ID=420261 /ORGANISM="Thalassiosira antarctica, Strain CCMP982" /LENGTH=37 /DNA_ID= /DNA_START= /DNA_END= /DNA_ORIENTATION=